MAVRLGRVRLRAFDPFGAERGVVGAWTELSITRVLNGLPTGKLVYHTGGQRAGLLAGPVEIGVELEIDGQWVEPANCRFISLSVESSGPGGEVCSVDLIGVGHGLSWAGVWDAQGNDRREFNAVSPGTMLGTLLTEAAARRDSSGLVWANGALSWDFTSTHDSAGARWPKNARKTWAISDSLLTVVQWWAEKGGVDWQMRGRKLEVFVAGTRLGPELDTVRLRGAATAGQPERASYADVATVAKFRGDGGVEYAKTASSAMRDFGRVERFTEQGNVKHEATATLYLDGVLEAGASEQREYKTQWPVGGQEGLPVGLVDYDLGAWVYLDAASARVRVVENGFKALPSGVVEGWDTMGTRLAALLERLARRTTDLSSGQVGSESGAPTPLEQPTGREPGKPRGLVVTARQVVLEGGRLAGSAGASWQAVTTDGDGRAVESPSYEVWVREGTGEVWRLVASTSEPASTFACPPLGTIEVKVRGCAQEGKPGVFSDVVSARVEPARGLVNPPANVTLSSRLGVIYVAWDGTTRASNGTTARVGSDYARLEVGVGMSEPTEVAGVSRSVPAVVAVGGQKRGQVVKVWARVVDVAGNASRWASAGRVTVVGVTGPDLEANSVTANSVDAGSVTGAVASFVQANARNLSAESARLARAVVDSITANNAVLNRLWADIIQGRMIRADQIIGDIVMADELRIGRWKIDPSALERMGTIKNPVEYGGSSLGYSEISSATVRAEDRVRVGGFSLNQHGHFDAPRINAPVFMASESLSLAIKGTNTGDGTRITKDGPGIWLSKPTGIEGLLEVKGIRCDGYDIFCLGVIATNGVATPSTRASKMFVEPLRDLTGILDVVPVCYRPKAAIDKWREQFGEEGPSRRLSKFPARRAGWVAEELEEAGLGIFVAKDDEGKPTGIDYATTSIALWQVAREQRDKIGALEERLARVETMLEKITNSQE